MSEEANIGQLDREFKKGGDLGSEWALDYSFVETKYLFFVVSLIAGASLPLAFAPFNLSLFAIISPALLLGVLQRKNVTPRQAFYVGFGYGIGMFGIGVSWVFISVHRFGGADIPLALFIVALLVLLLATFIAIQTYVLKRFFRGTQSQFLFLAFPSAWVLFEWVRSIAFTGFPWLFLGYSQLQTPLAGFAPIGSVYLISFAVALSAASLVAILNAWFSSERHPKLLPAFLLLILWGMGLFLQQIEWTKPLGPLRTVSLVQGNIPLMQKFDREDPIRMIRQTYGELTKPHWGQDIIIWPESAILVPLPYSKTYVEELSKMALNSGTTFITGIQAIDKSNHQYNSLIALGNGSGLYHKHHLLPYGDYLPFEYWLRGLISFFDLPNSSFSPGPKEQDLIKAGNLLLNPAICYEIAFPELIRDTLRDAAGIITLSEDGWFGDSMGPHQHLQIAMMRAKETGRAVLRATTSGITAIINAKGHLQSSAPQFQATVLSGNFQPMQGQTPWIIVGLWPLLVLLFVAFILPGRLKPK